MIDYKDTSSKLKFPKRSTNSIQKSANSSFFSRFRYEAIEKANIHTPWKNEKSPDGLSGLPSYHRRLCILDIINDPFPDLSRAILLTTFHLNFRCTDIGIKAGINCFTNQSPLFLQVEMLK